MRAQFRSTILLYIALFLGQIIICFFIMFSITKPDQHTLNEGSEYPFLALLVIFLAAGAAWYMNQLRTKTIKSLQANFNGKLMHYHTSVLLRSAMVEAGNLFCLILALLENSLAPMLFFCVGLAVFLYFRPKSTEIIRLYQLNETEQKLLIKQLKKH